MTCNNTQYHCNAIEQYMDEKLSKANILAFLKLSTTYRYQKIEILKLSKKYRYWKMHPILANKQMVSQTNLCTFSP